ncbi:MAG: PEP/pyruvate-binding domain-containing protein [Actinomycetia bacterium]|nr:PEP/pyruvate-binding domain-containing protein [Actinomycetes bacterium]
MSENIVWFNGYWKGLKGEVGGKGASLGEMTGAGLPVPPGFTLTCTAFRTSKEQSELDEDIARLLFELDTENTDMVTQRCREIREAFSKMEMVPEVEVDLRNAYRELCQVSGTQDIPVAVRSSATSEDSPDASFAGEHDTYLWIRGEEAVIDAVRRCWASLFTDRATCYRVEMGYEHKSVEMSVVIQKMVHPISAGVAFTLNPVNGDRSQVCIDSAWGFGESVVSGEVTPDNYLIDKVLMEIGQRKVSVKEMEFKLSDHDSVERAELDEERAKSPSLTDAQIKAIVKLAKLAEKHYGCPQDIEWAVDADLPEGSNVVLLQSRPETVWSKKTRSTSQGAQSSGDFMASIVSTLMNPLHTKK